MERRAKQSILISKDIVKSRQGAKIIARRFADRIYTIRETKNWYRFRQRPPEDFIEGSFRTFEVKKGVRVIYGTLKEHE